MAKGQRLWGRGNLSFVLNKKLQALKIDLKKWNKEVLGNVLVEKDAALEFTNTVMVIGE